MSGLEAPWGELQPGGAERTGPASRAPGEGGGEIRAGRLRPGAPCPYGLCDGDGFVVDEATRTARECRCRAQRVSQRRTRALQAVVPKRYRDVGFDRPPISNLSDTTVRPVRQYVRELDRMLDEGRGLWFFGTPGTGKTSLAMLISKAAIEAGRSVAIYSLPRLLGEIRATFNEDAELGYLELIDRLTSVDLLHIDDLGAENTTPWVLEQLYVLINTRYEEERALVVTTNLTDPSELNDQIGERTVSRIEEMCTPLPLFGGDARRFLA